MSEDSQKNSEDIWRLKERAEKYAEKAASEQLMRVGKVRAAGIEDLWKVYMDTFWPLFEVVTTTFPETEERRKLYIYMTDAAQALLHGVSDYLDDELYGILSNSITAASLQLHRVNHGQLTDDNPKE